MSLLAAAQRPLNNCWEQLKTSGTIIRNTWNNQPTKWQDYKNTGSELLNPYKSGKPTSENMSTTAKIATVASTVILTLSLASIVAVVITMAATVSLLPFIFILPGLFVERARYAIIAFKVFFAFTVALGIAGGALKYEQDKVFEKKGSEVGLGTLIKNAWNRKETTWGDGTTPVSTRAKIAIIAKGIFDKLCIGAYLTVGGILCFMTTSQVAAIALPLMCVLGVMLISKIGYFVADYIKNREFDKSIPQKPQADLIDLS